MTVAALIVLVREAWGEPGLHPMPTIAGWRVCGFHLIHDDHVDSLGPTELDAMHAALRARLEVTP